jgi:hypothetical protein
MNGRVYDPVLGRFLSPDPYIQAPDFAQNFNRYSYVFNNPLKYVDPSGYLSKPGAGFKRWFYYFMLKIRRDVNIVNYDDDPFGTDYIFYDGMGTSGGGGGASGSGGPGGPSGGNGGSAGGNSGGGGHGIGGSTLPTGEEDGDPPRVINSSKKIIWFKPEGDYTDPSDGRVYKNDKAYPIIPDHWTTVPIDGIAIDGEVYKITNGYECVIINEDDTYSTLYLGLKVTFGYWIRGGHLDTWPDDSWKPLFNH